MYVHLCEADHPSAKYSDLKDSLIDILFTANSRQLFLIVILFCNFYYSN